MISILEGTLIERAEGSVVVMAGGLGYQVFCSNTTLSALGTPAGPGASGPPVRLFTHLHVREDALQLYGFAEREERAVFLMLIAVSGVGPKVALALLSAFTPASLQSAVAAQDVAHISSVPGIGKKTAERLIVELRDKLSIPEELAAAARSRSPEVGVRLDEARQALMGLGYSSTEARLALGDLDAEGKSVEELVTEALRRLGG